MKEKQLRWKWKDATSLYVFLLSMCWVTEAKPLPWKWIYKFLKGSVASLSWKRLVRWQFTWEISQFVNSDKYPLADHLMNFFSQQSKNTNDFFYCDSWSKELFRECFMKFRNFSCSTKLFPGFLRVAVDISCFIRGHDFWVDWLYVNYCELDCCVFFKSLPLFISKLN